MSKVLHVGTIYWFSSLGNYPTETDIPAFSIITDASLHDSKVMDQIPYEKDSFYIFDRAYMVTKMLYHIHRTKAFFVVREKYKMLRTSPITIRRQA